MVDIHIMVNWQLSKKAICWPVSHDCIAGSWTLFNTPPPPSKKKLHNHCFQFLLGITVIPSKIEDNGYVKFWGGGGVNKVHYGLCDNGELNEWMVMCFVKLSTDQLLVLLIVGSVPKFPIVKETVSCIWFRWHRQVHFASVNTTLNDLLCTDVKNTSCVFDCIHFKNSGKGI